MLRSCSRCGRIHDSGFICNRGRNPLTDEQKLRNLNKWHQKSREIRERALYLCEVCKDQGSVNAGDDIEIHHITKLRDDPNGLLDNFNLIALCIPHHKSADAGELDPDYLRKLAREREERSLNDFPLL